MIRSFFRDFFDNLFSLRMVSTLLIILVVQYFFAPGPKKIVVHPLLNRDIHFVHQKNSVEQERVFVDTDLCEYEFSPEGGTLVGASFKKHLGKDGNFLKTIHEQGAFDRDQLAFLLALEGQTPLDYVFEARRDLVDGVEIDFATHTVDRAWKIIKTFKVFKDFYRVDLVLVFIPLKKDATPLVPRLFVPGPFLGEVEKNKVEGSVLAANDARLERISGASDEMEKYWESPAIVGAEDKYFLHALIGYEPGFLKQVFYKRATNTLSGGASQDTIKRVASATSLSIVCECVPVAEQVSVTFNWYCGPKSLRAIEKVDARLSSFMSFGWFSWIGKLLLSALETLYEHLGNYGWAIILLTILLRLLFMPIGLFGKYKSAKTEAVTRRCASEIAAINARYKDDATARQNELVALYERNGASYFGVAYAVGSSLLSVPIFLSLYGLLSSSIALYNAPFVGWIVNLGSPDSYYILPVLLCGVGFLYQHYTSAPQVKTSPLMRFIMPAFLFAISLIAPVGIVLYLGTNFLMIAVEEGVRAKFFSF